jgi:predicted glycosyltransferase
MSELQDKYGLIYSFHEEEKLLEKLDEVLADLGKSKSEWMTKRERFLNDKIDVTAFLVWFLETYPKSLEEVRSNPAVQHSFK